MDNNDVDSLLLQQFSSMATQDRDVLIAEFQRLLGNQLNDTSCAFYLDMNNWNLQDAICSYFEYTSDAQILRLPHMGVVVEPGSVGSIGQDQSPTIVAPNSCLTRVWHVMNTGDEPWPVGCSMRQVGGYQLSAASQIAVESLAPGNSTHVRLELVSPAAEGIYKAQWRMSTVTGAYFGELLWVVVQVINGMMTGISDQTIPNQTIDYPPMQILPNPTITYQTATPPATASIDTNIPLSLLDAVAAPVFDDAVMSATNSPPSFSTGADFDNMDMS